MTSKSAAKLIPSDPTKVMSIRDIVPGTITTLSVPFSRFGLFSIGGRATMVKLRTGSLAVFSPVALTPTVQQKVSSMGGEVKYLIAPDFEHHIFLSPWAKQYPAAQVIGPEGLPEKREADPATAGLKFAHVFTPSNKRDMRISEEFDAEFDYEYFHSHQNKELAFLHKPTGTLIEADLMFNLPATEQYSKTQPFEDPRGGVLNKLFNGLMGSQGEMKWQRRFLWYAAGGKDRVGMGESAKIIKGWQYERVIPCHGDVIETGGKARVDLLLSWFRDGK